MDNHISLFCVDVIPYPYPYPGAGSSELRYEKKPRDYIMKPLC